MDGAASAPEHPASGDRRKPRTPGSRKPATQEAKNLKGTYGGIRSSHAIRRPRA